MGESLVATLFANGVSYVYCSGLMTKSVEQDPDHVLVPFVCHVEMYNIRYSP